MIRAVDKWLWGYLKSILRRPRNRSRLTHLLFCVADHFEPLGNADSAPAARAALADWLETYERRLGDFRDADGCPPRHTFFYPAEEYDEGCLDRLAAFCRAGWGEVEIQLHHRNDTPERLRERLLAFRDRLHARHGLLGQDATGAVRYGFVHGNWALCNARPDGDWCGVNEELRVLAETGCYADFTFPSAPSPTQPRMVNALYRAWDRPGRPRGQDRGVLCRTHPARPLAALEGALLLIQGPLGLDWRRRKRGMFPRLETGELSAVNPPTPRRVDLWVRQGIHVIGRPDWIFVKVHTHGCRPAHRETLLGWPAICLHRYLASRYTIENGWSFHYVTAREMFNVVSAAEQGRAGNPGLWRNAIIHPPGEVPPRGAPHSTAEGGFLALQRSGAAKNEKGSRL